MYIYIFFALNQNKNTRRLCQVSQEGRYILNYVYTIHLRDDVLIISSVCKVNFVSTLVYMAERMYTRNQ